MAYLIPIGSMSYQTQQEMRQNAVISGKQALVQAAVVTSPQGSIDRDAEYPLDFVPAATRAGLSGWLSMPFVLAATVYSLFANNVPAALTPQVPNNAVWVFYGVHVLTAGQPATQLYFAYGNNAIRRANFDLEKLYDKQETSGYFTVPQVYGPNDIVTVQLLSRIALGAGVGCRVALDTIIIEPNQVNQV